MVLMSAFGSMPPAATIRALQDAGTTVLLSVSSSEEAVEAAYGAATVMAMNNVAYRAKSWLGDDYANVKFGLRMNIISKPGVEKADFELWSLAVSTINGCEHCAVAHANTVREEGVTKEQVWEAVKVAGVVQAVAQAIAIEDAR